VTWQPGNSIAKASTANDFSNSALALSTANLYAPTQPGGSLYGLNNSNPFNPLFEPQISGVGLVPRWHYHLWGVASPSIRTGKVIGALGVSGDRLARPARTQLRFACANLRNLDGIPSGVAPDSTDNIIYAPPASPTGFEHPHCFPTDLTPAEVETGA